MFNRSKSGFTIVELLIVIVVIGILAAIIIVAYNGIQTRAQNTTVQSDVRNNATRLSLFKADKDRPATIAELSSDSSITPKFGDSSTIRIAAYCVADNQYVVGAESVSNQKYYSRNGSAVTNDNSITLPNICGSLGITKSDTTAADAALIANGGVINLSNPCAAENQTCSFSGTRTVAYGTNQTFIYRSATSSIVCSNAEYGSDPVPGIAKSCYVIGS